MPLNKDTKPGWMLPFAAWNILTETALSIITFQSFHTSMLQSFEHSDIYEHTWYIYK